MTISGYRPVTAVSRLAVSALFILSSALCHAEDLPDPTRPPASIRWGSDATSVSVGLEAETRPTGLQSTIISRTRRAAIINGKTVELGEQHEGARLIEVNESSVVLQGAQTKRVLTLFPGVKMTQRDNKTSNTLPESRVQPDEATTVPGAPEEAK